MYTINRVGIISAFKVGAILSALLAVVPILVLLLLDSLFHLWGISIPPRELIRILANTAFWAAISGGISTAIIAFLYNIGARLFGGLEIEIRSKSKGKREQVDIE